MSNAGAEGGTLLNVQKWSGGKGRRGGGGERLDRCLAILTAKAVVVGLVLAGWLRERKQWGEIDLLQLLLLFLVCECRFCYRTSTFSLATQVSLWYSIKNSFRH